MTSNQLDLKLEPDCGYFPAGKSVLRKVHEERIVGALYGQRALLMQAADPVAFTGLLGSTKGLAAPFKRLARTAKLMETVFFCSRAEADQVTSRVRRMHSHVHGTISGGVGPYPPGTEFSAEDPNLLLWILACLADSALSVYHAFVGTLSAGELEDFWSDYLVLGELFGLPRESAPANYREFRRYMRNRLNSKQLFVTDEARSLGLRVAFAVPVPAPCLPALPALDFAIAALLPRRIRQLYRIPWTVAHDAAFRSSVLAARAARPFVPRSIRVGRSSFQYGVVAQTEALRQGFARKLRAVAGSIK